MQTAVLKHNHMGVEAVRNTQSEKTAHKTIQIDAKGRVLARSCEAASVFFFNLHGSTLISIAAHLLSTTVALVENVRGRQKYESFLSRFLCRSSTALKHIWNFCDQEVLNVLIFLNALINTLKIKFLANG